MGHQSVYGNTRNMISCSIKDQWFLRSRQDVRTWSGITTTTTDIKWNSASTRRIYRSWAVHRALTRLVRKCVTWWNYTPNMVDFDDVFFLCDGGWKSRRAKSTSPILAPGREDPSDPLRPPPSATMMKPTIRMARYDPNRPMTASWGGNLTIWSLQRP